MEFRR